MSDKTALSGAALTTAGLLAAGVFSSRAARAGTPTTHVTFYAVTPPSATVDPNVVQIPEHLQPVYVAQHRRPGGELRAGR